MSVVDQLIDLIALQDGEGRFVHQKEDVEHVLPLLLAPALDLKQEQQPEGLRRFFEAFVLKIVGPSHGSGSTEFLKKELAQHYETYPPEPKLLLAIKRIFREAFMMQDGMAPEQTAGQLFESLGHQVGTKTVHEKRHHRLTATFFEKG